MIIQSDKQLTDLCSALAGEALLFLDTEFVSEGRYYPDLGTIQLAAGEYVALIDPLPIRDMSPLIALLVDKSICKVFHACGQDLPILYRLCGQPVRNIFDTQIATALLGIDEQISFANLVERVTGEHLQKSHSFTDWMRRPLSPGQVEYALDDVRYLMPAYQWVHDQLSELQRLEWAGEEFLPLEDETRFIPPDPEELYLRIRGVDRMNGRSLSMLKELAMWRDDLARSLNLSLGRILRDEVMMELARRPRTQITELREIRGIQHEQINKFGQQLLKILSNTELPPCPTIKRNSSLAPSLEPTVDFLSLCLRSLSSERKISPGMLANRSDLAELIKNGEKANIALLRGWRRQAVGEELLATLQGQVTARLLPQTRKVHLDWNSPASE